MANWLDRKLSATAQNVQEQSAKNTTLPETKPIDSASVPDLNKQQVEHTANYLNTPDTVRQYNGGDEVEIKPTPAAPTAPTTPEYDEYAGLDDVAKKRAQGIMQAENLQAQIDAAKWAEETPEQQAARLKKERRERNLAGALGLLGAMGNFAVAAAHPSGRSVPVANISDAVEKRQTAAQKERELALGKLKGARGRRAQILEQGYADTEKRKQLAEQEAYRKSQLEMQNKQLARQAANDAYNRDLNERKLQHTIEKDKAAQEQKAKVDASTIYKNYAAAAKYKNGGGGSNGKTDTNFHIENADGSVTKVAISKQDYDTAMTKAYDKLSSTAKDYAETAIKEVVTNILEDNNATEAEREYANLFKKTNNARKWITMNPKIFHQILQKVENNKGELKGYEEALKYLQKIGTTSSGSKADVDEDEDFSEYKEDETQDDGNY